ncbi:uncharacterized protein LOC132712844 [Ruditapes philippinarum]|uniref:uncharacterized protein LOC132712844 n=1 Tax=Ruditapes philippinarum TaxID=129788 RepID=UPI00295BA9C7|nr:uncharacterized protein LOC132712844 [Ruditapes philippinarum]
MAEGGEHSISVRGSDADFEYLCTPCADDGNDEQALKYCPECKEYLCAACIKCHLKFSATKKHTLYDNEYQHYEGDSVDTTSDEEHGFKCVFHPDRDIEIYCGDHDMVYCALCVAKEHRQCSGILELEEAADKIPVNKQENILHQIDCLQVKIQVSRQKKEVNLIALDQDKNDILKTIEDVERMMINKVKALASDAKANTCTRYDSLKKDIQDEDLVLLRAITDTVELRKKLETQADLDAKWQFTRYILHRYIIAKAENMHDRVEKDEKKMKCFKNDELIQKVSTADCLVQVVGSKISVKNNDKPIHQKSRKEVIIKGNGDIETCSIYGICQLTDETIVLADHTNKKLKRLDKDFSIIDSLKLESNPVSLCLTGKTEVAVKLKNDTIQFISITDKFIEKQLINLEGGYHIGLIFNCNELWSYSGTGINACNREGLIIKSFNKNSFEGTLFNPLGKHLIPIAADKEFIYISDLKSQVACIDREGNVWSVIKAERLELITRACFAPNGIMFLAGYTSGNIMILNEKGKCLGELVDGLINPDSLCYDNKNHQLIIGHKNKDILTIITTDECL